MKRFVIPFILLCVAFACACVFLLQPLRLVSGSSTRLTVHLGKTVELVGIAELAAYVTDTKNGEKWYDAHWDSKLKHGYLMHCSRTLTLTDFLTIS